MAPLNGRTARGLFGAILVAVLLRLLWTSIPSWKLTARTPNTTHRPVGEAIHVDVEADREPASSGTEPSYRELLANVLPKDKFEPSRTLFPPSVTEGGESAIYAISLARRLDRRETLSKIAAALDLDFVFIDATDAADATPGGGGELVEQLYQRVGWQRWWRIDERAARKSELRPDEYDETSDSHFVRGAFPFEWSTEVKPMMREIRAWRDGTTEVDMPERWSGADFWDLTVPGSKEWAEAHPMDKKLHTKGPKWKTELHISQVENTLRKFTNLTRAAVACWHSHIITLRDVVERNLSAALILEDDVDIDFNIQPLLHAQLPHLRAGWDIVYLGHCLSPEHKNDPLPSAPRFRRSAGPLCLHGYAVSRKGARKLLKFLRSPDFAYSRPVDWAPLDLMRLGLLKSFSAFPPLIVQRKEDLSDIEGEIGLRTDWKTVEGELEDSTLARIRAFEALQAVGAGKDLDLDDTLGEMGPVVRDTTSTSPLTATATAWHHRLKSNHQ